MQYILSQEELDELKKKQRHEISENKSKLQKLCSKIADSWIVEEGWYKGKAWGCILTSMRKEEWYCDDCIMKSICPYDGKIWSK